eukprot:15277824-Alexandrium_andersonii.AAC.1
MVLPQPRAVRTGARTAVAEPPHEGAASFLSELAVGARAQPGGHWLQGQEHCRAAIEQLDEAWA